MEIPRASSKESPLNGMRGGNGDGARAGAATRMRQALAAVTDGKGSREQLAGAARELVNELRARDEPPEQVLLQIKELLGEAGLRPSYASPDETTGPDSALYRDVIAWSIRFYYDGDGR